MKLNRLKQIIKEEISEVLETLEQSQSSGLITFEQLKQACIDDYTQILIGNLEQMDDLYYVGNIADVDGSPWVDLETAESIIKDNNDELNQAMNVDELVNVLDGLGFNGGEAYDFIFDSILK